MKQRFKHDTLTQRKCINSILRFFALANPAELREGMTWYNDAHTYTAELASRFEITISQAAGIIAAFSPQTGWQENKRYALSYLIAPKNRVRSLAQHLKAKKILAIKNEANIYSALSVNDAAWKTKAFFMNILNPDIITSVTIDRHAIACCIQNPDNVEALSEQYGKLTEKQYTFFETCYMEAAKELDILPHQLQAIVWVTYRRLRNLRTYSRKMEWQPFTTEVTF